MTSDIRRVCQMIIARNVGCIMCYNHSTQYTNFLHINKKFWIINIFTNNPLLQSIKFNVVFPIWIFQNGIL